MSDEAPHAPDPAPLPDAAPDAADAPPEEAAAPQLPASFFSRLVHQPKCITDGVCNNCGRCEH